MKYVWHFLTIFLRFSFLVLRPEVCNVIYCLETFSFFLYLVWFCQIHEELKEVAWSYDFAACRNKRGANEDRCTIEFMSFKGPKETPNGSKAINRSFITSGTCFDPRSMQRKLHVLVVLELNVCDETDRYSESWTLDAFPSFVRSNYGLMNILATNDHAVNNGAGRDDVFT